MKTYLLSDSLPFSVEIFLLFGIGARDKHCKNKSCTAAVFTSIDSILAAILKDKRNHHSNSKFSDQVSLCWSNLKAWLSSIPAKVAKLVLLMCAKIRD